jgi:hypothetical protein
MTDSNAEQPAEGQLTDRLSAPRTGPGTARKRAVTLLRRLDNYDHAAYRWVAQLRIPLLDEPLRLVSDFANFSKPWFLISGLLAPFGGSRGRRAALTGLAAIGTASLVVNQPMNLAGERHGPTRLVTALGGLLGGSVGLILAVIAADAIGRLRSKGFIDEVAVRRVLG